MEAKEREELKKGMRTLWIIWAAMLGSLAIYVIVCHVMTDKIKIDMGPDFPFTVFKNILYLIAALELVILHFMRKFMLKVRSSKQIEISASDYKSILSKYTTALMVSLAIADSIGIYGVILFFIGRDFHGLYLFITISAMAMFIYRPKIEEVEKLEVEKSVTH